MTVKELGEKMDAVELMEWMAFYMLQDDKQKERIENLDKNIAANKMRNFLSTLRPAKKNNDK